MVPAPGTGSVLVPGKLIFPVLGTGSVPVPGKLMVKVPGTETVLLSKWIYSELA